jgi:ribonuclease VapC
MSREEEDQILGYGPEGTEAMVLDSSAIVAIHLREPGHEGLMDRIDDAEVVVALAFLRRLEAEVVPFNEAHLDAAASAFIRFGRGRHPAALNFGDCMSYAIASVAGMPLLFIGEDFRRTDIAQA